MSNERKRNNKNNPMIKKRKQRRRKRRLKVFFVSLFLIVLFLIGYGAYYVNNILNNVNRKEISQSNKDLGIDENNLDAGAGKVSNILLLGVDSRSENDKGRSDAMMILTVDPGNNKIKLSSLMRDMRVSIEDHGKDKLNHAYAFGGAPLAIKTVNQNFNLDIRDYVLVDYNGLEAIIDALGGIQIEIKENEFDMVNDYIHDLAVLKDVTPPYLDAPGAQTISGIQAVAYARIRYVGNGDYERTERQRRVLSAIFEKIQTAGVTKYPNIVNKLLPYVETSMDTMEMVNLGTKMLMSGFNNIEQTRFPVDGYCDGSTIKGTWYLVFNKKVTTEQIHQYIYEDIAPVAGNINKPDLGD